MLTVHASKSALARSIPADLVTGGVRTSPHRTHLKYGLKAQNIHYKFQTGLDDSIGSTVAQTINTVEGYFDIKHPAWIPIVENHRLVAVNRMDKVALSQLDNYGNYRWVGVSTAVGFVIDFGLGFAFEHFSNYQDSNLSAIQKRNRNRVAGLGGGVFGVAGGLGGYALSGAICASSVVCGTVLAIGGAIGGAILWGKTQPYAFESLELNPTYDNLRPLGGN